MYMLRWLWQLCAGAGRYRSSCSADKVVRSRCRSRNARCCRCSELAGKHCWCGGSTAQNGEI
ncbi:hypothetical protein TYRP_016737 [Tyrophagus putrescentiae]|nr:hypothetical protein TYRP_016737 [Tyrophagus putrescentiae]